MSLARVQNLAISLDGFGTGEGLSRDSPFGHADERLHEWMFETRWWRARSSQPDGTGGIDYATIRQHAAAIGAQIMGALGRASCRARGCPYVLYHQVAEYPKN